MNPLTVVPTVFDLQLFQAMPGNSALLLPDVPLFTIVAVTNDYCKTSGRSKEELIGKGLFEAFPNPPDDPDLTSEKRARTSLEKALFEKVPHRFPFYRYDIPNAEGYFEECYWSATNKPVLSATGEVLYIIHSAIDVTDKVMADKRLETIRGFEKAYAFFMAAPVIVGFLRGDNYVIELANEWLLEVWGREPDVIGKPLFEAIPELSGQGFKALLDQVRTTGETFSANEYPITLNRHGKEEVLYFNFIYKPFYEDSTEGTASGIFSVGHDVTAQVLAKRKIEESEEKYRSLFESMDQGYCTLEIIIGEEGNCTDYRYMEINPAFERQSGLIGAIGKTIRELAPSIEPKWFDFYGSVALTGKPIRVEEESTALNKWFEVYAVRLGSDEERKVGVFFTDISERKKAEEAIKQSENNLRNTILQAPVAMAILRGPSFVVDIANQRMYELWGRGPEHLLNKSIFEGLPEAKDQGYEELLTGVFTTGKTFTANSIPVILPRDGRVDTVYINLTYEAYREADGTISGVIAVATEVTEQVLSRQKLEESHRELQFVMDVMPQMVWHTQPDGTADFFNKVYLDYTGRPMEGLTGNGWFDLIHQDDLAITREAWKHAIEGGNDDYTVEHRLRGKNGTYCWFLTRGVPLKDENGKPVKWYGTSTNIHEQKSVEEELEQRVDERTADLQESNKSLKRANTELEQFTYVSHHDLQEPLRKIIMFSDMVQSDNKNQLTEASQQRLERVTSAARRMSAALRDVLDYASLNREEAAVQVDLEEVLAAVQQDLELLITEKKANIMSQTLPTVNAIPGQMHQLFYNLINNALKFTNPGKQPVINITCRKLDKTEASTHTELNLGKHYYHIMVQDNGIGFQPDAAERIFGMFQRLHSKDAYAGTGIGLALVKKVVMNHHGKIWAESSPGEGSSFNVLLPV